MVWAPSKAVITPRALAVNLLTYFGTHQADALTWAGGTGLVALRAYSTVASRVDNKPIYPMISFLDDNDSVIYGNDLSEAAYQVTFEVVIENTNPATAVENAKIYAKALVSMIINCPAADLATGTGATQGSITCQEIETGFDEIKHIDKKDFFQVFQIRAAFTLMNSYHS